jgi:DNA-3-methyladenine glycosylase
MDGLHLTTMTAEAAARELLGRVLVHHSPQGRLAGRIVETEAYNQDDPASHTYRGATKRNQPMFEAGGTIYIYFTYGMHYCLNIVAGPAGRGEGVLIRAIEPLEGLAQMRLNRQHRPDHQLTNGPAKVVQAFGISPLLSGRRLGEELSLEPGSPPLSIVETTRIGIKHGRDTKWRFYIAGNPYVSKQ